MASHQEFQRELQRSGVEPHIARLFTILFERLIHVAKETETASSICLSLANSMDGIVQLHEQTQQKMKELAKHNKTEGIEVKSELM